VSIEQTNDAKCAELVEFLKKIETTFYSAPERLE
jgi:hypothetical protein